jgi:glucose uptake protein GlcU
MAGSDYHRGDMDIAEQTATFHLIMGITKWGSLVTAALLLFLALMFCTATGFLGSTAWTVVVLAAGIVLLREKKSAAH